MLYLQRVEIPVKHYLKESLQFAGLVYKVYSCLHV